MAVEGAKDPVQLWHLPCHAKTRIVRRLCEAGTGEIAFTKPGGERQVRRRLVVIRQVLLDQPACRVVGFAEIGSAAVVEVDSE